MLTWNDPERALRATEAFWRAWSDRCAPAERWTDSVKRSLTVLNREMFYFEPERLHYQLKGRSSGPTT